LDHRGASKLQLPGDCHLCHQAAVSDMTYSMKLLGRFAESGG
jgi:hypothetical protein